MIIRLCFEENYRNYSKFTISVVRIGVEAVRFKRIMFDVDASL